MNPGHFIPRRRYMVSTHESRGNPLFPQKRREEKRRGPLRVVSGLLLLALAAGAIYLAIWSSVFRLGIITVDGNRFTKTDDVLSVITGVWSRQRWLILPGQNYFTFSTRTAEKRIQERLGAEQALASLKVTKHLPSRIDVAIVERTPRVLYSNGGVRFLVDRSGVVASTTESGQHLDPSLPALYDQTTRPVLVGTQVLPKQLVDALFAIQEQIQKNTDIPIDFFYVPPVSCKVFLPIVETHKEPEAVTTNGAAINANRSAATNTDPTVRNVNTNSNSGPAIGESPAEPPCDKAAEALSNTDLRLKSTEDWEIFFRTTDGAEKQVARLLRVLQERRLDRTKLDYIDLRFGEEVILK